MWLFAFQLNDPIDGVALAWAIGTFFLGCFALYRAGNIVRIMRQMKYPSDQWWKGKGFTEKELESTMTLYARMFGIVWLLCGFFWVYWVLFHQY